MTPRVLVVSEQQVTIGSDPHLPTAHLLSAGTVNDLLGLGCTVTLMLRSTGAVPANFPAVPSIVALPPFTGLGGLLRHLPAVMGPVRRAIRDADLVVLRVPGMIGLLAYTTARRRRVPCVVEVMGGFPPRAHLRSEQGTFAVVLYALWRKAARWQVRHATAALYVTRDSLQQQFPTDGLSAGISDVQIDPEWRISPDTRQFWTGDGPARLLFVGSLQHRGKGLDTLLHAMGELRDYPIHLTIVGSGQFLPEYRALAAELALESDITWLGEVNRDGMHDLMVSAHLLVLPSRHEGMPRVLVEAMACSLPCVATAVGGILELADGCELVVPDDPVGLAVAIGNILQSPATQAARARAASHCAARFAHESLSQARRAFWQGVIPQ